MKIIISESHYKLIRRLSMLEDEVKKEADNYVVDNFIDLVKLELFIMNVIQVAANNVADDTMKGDQDRIMVRNQMVQWARNNMYNYLKNFWQSYQK